MKICPCCNQPVPARFHPGSALDGVGVKTKTDKRLVQDRVKAEAAIKACENALTNPYFEGIAAAVQLEKERMEQAMSDPAVLWSIYRRKDKGQPYFSKTEAQLANAA